MNPLDLWDKLDERGILDRAAPGMYLRGLLENFNPFDASTATERILDPDEFEVIRDVVKKNVAGGRAGVTYSDFLTQEEGAEPLSYLA